MELTKKRPLGHSEQFVAESMHDSQLGEQADEKNRKSKVFFEIISNKNVYLSKRTMNPCINSVKNTNNLGL